MTARAGRTGGREFWQERWGIFRCAAALLVTAYLTHSINHWRTYLLTEPLTLLLTLPSGCPIKRILSSASQSTYVILARSSVITYMNRSRNENGSPCIGPCDDVVGAHMLYTTFWEDTRREEENWFPILTCPMSLRDLSKKTCPISDPLFLKHIAYLVAKKTA